MAGRLSTINPYILISAEFSNHTLAGLRGQINGSALKYYIHLAEEDVSLEDGSSAHSAGHSEEDITFIDNIFLRLDPLVELDFEKRLSFDGTLLDIYSIDFHSEWDDSTVGQVFDQGAFERSYWDVLWRDTDGESTLSEFDANSIIHEIGHALGLSHPDEDPNNEAWNTTDTVMSYNEGDRGWDNWFSEADIKALQLIWGVETGKEIFAPINDDNTDAPEEAGNNYFGTNIGDQLTGSNGPDSFQAFSGDDLIYARGGDDVIRMGKGEDYAWGGDGADIFVVNLKAKKGRKSIDFIMDFQPGVDEILIEGSTRGYELSTFEDSSYISKGAKIFAWIDGVTDISWTSNFTIS